jgi:DNA primase
VNEQNGEDLLKVFWYYNLIPSKSVGDTEKIVCPLHGDVNPSLLLDFNNGSWFCFGCQQGGDAKKFVKLIERKNNGLNDLQSYKKYLQILKSDKCSDVKYKTSAIKKRQSNANLYNQAYDYYHGLKKIDWNLDDQDLIQFKDYMLNRGFKVSTLNKCKAKITYNRNYGLIFPMIDNGKFKGWVCRTTIEEVEKRRKYLYNEGFSRATTLVGNYGSKNYIFIVEGYMDRLKFIQFGEESVVAILGWKMSQEQIQKIRSQSKIEYVISALDNDECGKKGSEYLRKVFGKQYIRFKYIKGIKDPGEMNQKLFDKMCKKTMEDLKNGIT